MQSKRLVRAVCCIAVVLCSLAPGDLTVPGISKASAQKATSKTRRVTTDPTGCRRCHREAVDGYAESKMSHSMRLGGSEPDGSVSVEGTSIRMFSDAQGSWQSLTSGGVTTEHRVDYVIGSGTHASGYIMNIGDHLFQSPVTYYRNRGAYGLAPGYETASDPDFTRPIAVGCIFCHSGSFNPVAGTENQYGKPAFTHLAIGCDRCHGSAAAHLIKPSMSNIVSPGLQERGARDSICEQCHLIGVARVLNPGKKFTDFRPGQRLEDTFTVYHDEAPKGAEAEFRVISHSEQLALSSCARNSEGKLWCGTCHDPHYQPTERSSYYRDRCLLCHAASTLAEGHPPKTSDCIRCHMPQRTTNDGGHTAFTDHRIQRRPLAGNVQQGTSIAAWREAPKEFATRNLGIASIEVGLERKAPAQIVSGYRTLTQVQRQFPRDSDLFNTMGDALYLGNQYSEAAKAFEMAVSFEPGSSQKETNLGKAYQSLGQFDLAVLHLENAIQIDSLNLDAATNLIALYEKMGKPSKAEDLSRRIGGQIKSETRQGR